MLVRLFDPVVQFQNKGGALNTAGRLDVYLEGTDELAQIYVDEEGLVPLSQPVILDNNGRSRGLYVESGVKYRLAVHTNHGALLFTVRNMVPVGGGGGGGQSLSASLPLKIEGGTITNNGTGITCTGENAWAEGHNTTASGGHSHAEGSGSIASGDNAHAEGGNTKATHPHAHAEGFHTEATATSAHAEGSGAKATTTTAHAEGQDTVASGDASHAQGRNSVASGDYSHASGYGTRATGQGSHAVGKYNDDGSALFVVGHGSGPNQRKDVFKVDSNEDTWVMIGGVLTKVTNVSGGGGSGDQFVLVRADMTTQFTNTEYQDCVDAVTAGKAVCVQFGRNDRIFQAQLTQVEPDTGLLVFEVDVAHIHITYEVSGTNNSHTITESDYQNGTVIFGTLQDAITWNVVLHNGDIFETNGFHTSGDGGAARYKVSSSGTANGKNIIQLAAGKVAYLQYEDWVIPEQLGYNHSDDVVPYISHAISTMSVQHIKLLARGTYHWKTTLVVNMVNGFELVGEGDWGYPRKFTYINVDPTTDIGCMMKLAGRSITLKNLDIEVTGAQQLLIDGITSDSYADGAEFYFTFDNIRMNSFKECWKLAGGIKWHFIFNECQPANCKIGIHFFESSTMLVNMKEVYFNHCADIGLWFEGNLYTAKIDACNFGSMNTAVKLSVNSSQYLYQNVRFDCCNFEDDNVSTGSRDAVFIDAYDVQHLDIRQNITISNSNFTLAKGSSPVQDTTNRYIRLGKKTNIVLINNQILGKDEPEHPEWVVYPKLLWNTSVVPTEGSITEVGNNLFFDYPDELAPYTFRNGRAVGFKCSNAENPTQPALSDCNDFLPLHNGEMRTARVSTYESTANMPASNIFGYLMVFGVIDDPNKRVLQVLFASNNNIYTRVIRDIGSGWTYLAWKTITAT